MEEKICSKEEESFPLVGISTKETEDIAEEGGTIEQISLPDEAASEFLRPSEVTTMVWMWAARPGFWKEDGRAMKEANTTEIVNYMGIGGGDNKGSYGKEKIAECKIIKEANSTVEKVNTIKGSGNNGRSSGKERNVGSRVDKKKKSKKNWKGNKKVSTVKNSGSAIQETSKIEKPNLLEKSTNTGNEDADAEECIIEKVIFNEYGDGNMKGRVCESSTEVKVNEIIEEKELNALDENALKGLTVFQNEWSDAEMRKKQKEGKDANNKDTSEKSEVNLKNCETNDRESTSENYMGLIGQVKHFEQVNEPQLNMNEKEATIEVSLDISNSSDKRGEKGKNINMNDVNIKDDAVEKFNISEGKFTVVNSVDKDITETRIYNEDKNIELRIQSKDESEMKIQVIDQSINELIIMDENEIIKPQDDDKDISEVRIQDEDDNMNILKITDEVINRVRIEDEDKNIESRILGKHESISNLKIQDNDGLRIMSEDEIIKPQDDDKDISEGSIQDEDDNVKILRITDQIINSVKIEDEDKGISELRIQGKDESITKLKIQGNDEINNEGRIMSEDEIVKSQDDGNDLNETEIQDEDHSMNILKITDEFINKMRIENEDKNINELMIQDTNESVRETKIQDKDQSINEVRILDEDVSINEVKSRGNKETISIQDNNCGINETRIQSEHKSVIDEDVSIDNAGTEDEDKYSDELRSQCEVESISEVRIKDEFENIKVRCGDKSSNELRTTDEKVSNEIQVDEKEINEAKIQNKDDCINVLRIMDVKNINEKETKDQGDCVHELRIENEKIINIDRTENQTIEETIEDEKYNSGEIIKDLETSIDELEIKDKYEENFEMKIKNELRSAVNVRDKEDKACAEHTNLVDILSSGKEFEVKCTKDANINSEVSIRKEKVGLVDEKNNIASIKEGKFCIETNVNVEDINIGETSDKNSNAREKVISLCQQDTVEEDRFETMDRIDIEENTNEVIIEANSSGQMELNYQKGENSTGDGSTMINFESTDESCRKEKQSIEKEIIVGKDEFRLSDEKNSNQAGSTTESAETYDIKVGKWMLFLDKCIRDANGDTALDRAWKEITKLVDQSKLFVAKCSTAVGESGSINKDRNGVIICYTTDYTNTEDVKKAADIIRNVINLPKPMFYKTDKATNEGKYRGAGWKYVSLYKHDSNGNLFVRDGFQWKAVSTEVMETLNELPNRPSEIQFTGKITAREDDNSLFDSRAGKWIFFLDRVEKDDEGNTELDRAWLKIKTLVTDGLLCNAVCTTGMKKQTPGLNNNEGPIFCYTHHYGDIESAKQAADAIRKVVSFSNDMVYKRNDQPQHRYKQNFKHKSVSIYKHTKDFVFYERIYGKWVSRTSQL